MRNLPLPLVIGLRYTRAKRKNNFISFISLISILGIALGVMTLIVVLSVMNGFEKELRERILGMVSHVNVGTFYDSIDSNQIDELKQALKSDTRVIGVAPYIEFESMVTSKSQQSVDSQVSGALIRGVDPEQETEVADIHNEMIVGDMANLVAGEFGIVLGKELALHMQAGLGDKITLITPKATVTPAGVLPRHKRFTVVGIFSLGMYEYDRSSAYININDASRLLQKDGKVDGVKAKLENMFLAPTVGNDLSKKLSENYWITDWTRQHANFFKAVRTEKIIMFIILMLIVAVAAFNIISTLVMLVEDKRSDIAILRTLGFTPRQVMSVFIIQGTMIGLVGTLLGLVLGVLLALNVETLVPAIESMVGVKIFQSDVYPISDLPSDLRWADVRTIIGLSLVLTIISTIYPAYRASKTLPAEALRYE